MCRIMIKEAQDTCVLTLLTQLSSLLQAVGLERWLFTFSPCCSRKCPVRLQMAQWDRLAPRQRQRFTGLPNEMVFLKRKEFQLHTGMEKGSGERSFLLEETHIGIYHRVGTTGIYLEKKNQSFVISHYTKT